MNKFIVVILAVLVSGCVSYHQFGTPSETYNASAHECYKTAFSNEGGTVMLAGLFGPIGAAIGGASTGHDNKQVYLDCMKSKGWIVND